MNEGFNLGGLTNRPRCYQNADWVSKEAEEKAQELKGYSGVPKEKWMAVVLRCNVPDEDAAQKARKKSEGKSEEADDCFREKNLIRVEQWKRGESIFQNDFSEKLGNDYWKRQNRFPERFSQIVKYFEKPFYVSRLSWFFRFVRLFNVLIHIY